MQRQSKAGTPFFCWYNSTRMHLRTHVREEHRSPKGATALTEYADGMVEHDGTVGSLLKTLDRVPGTPYLSRLPVGLVAAGIPPDFCTP